MWWCILETHGGAASFSLEPRTVLVRLGPAGRPAFTPISSSEIKAAQHHLEPGSAFLSLPITDASKLFHSPPHSLPPTALAVSSLNSLVSQRCGRSRKEHLHVLGGPGFRLRRLPVPRAGLLASPPTPWTPSICLLSGCSWAAF